MSKNYCVICKKLLEHNGVICSEAHNPDISNYEYYDGNGNSFKLTENTKLSHIDYCKMMGKKFL